MFTRLTWIAAAVLASSSLASATDIAVSPGQSIQAAIGQAVNGDRVLVAPGTYQQKIDFLGKNIEVIGVGGAAATILDGGGAFGTLVYFKKNEPPTAKFSGFTVRNGSIGIEVQGNAKPTLSRLIVEGQKAFGSTTGVGFFSNGIGASAPWPRIEECIVRNNGHAGIWGGFFALRCVISGNNDSGALSATLQECLITGNVGFRGGGVASCQVTRCVITNNTATFEGGGVYWNGYGPYLSISECEISGNHAGTSGGGVYAEILLAENTAGAYPTLAVERCIIRDNTAATEGAMHLRADRYYPGFPSGRIDLTRSTFRGNSPNFGTATATYKDMFSCTVWNQPGATTFTTAYCNLENNPGGGTNNISADPLFVDPANGDLHITPASPCIDKADPAAGRDFEADPPAGTADIGGDEFAPHLYIPGLVASGGPITLNTIGSPGAPVMLFASLTNSAVGVPTPFGFFGLGFPLLPAFPLDLGPIPASSRLSISTTVPAAVPMGTVIYMQAYVGGVSPTLTPPLTLLIT